MLRAVGWVFALPVASYACAEAALPTEVASASDTQVYDHGGGGPGTAGDHILPYSIGFGVKHGALTTSAQQQAALDCIQQLHDATKGWTEADDNQLAQYEGCVRDFYGTPSKPWQAILAAKLASEITSATPPDKQPNGAQAALLSKWLDDRRGDVAFDWDRQKGTLARAQGRLTAGHVGTASAVLPKIVAELQPRLDALCLAPQGPTWQVYSDTAGHFAKRRHAKLYRWLNGVRIRGDHIELGYGPDQNHAGLWRADALGFRCTRMLAVPATTPTIAKDAAKVIAGGAFLPQEALTTADGALVIDEHQGTPHLIWALRAAKASDTKGVDVDAHTGEVLAVRSERVHGAAHSGTLSMQVRRPYQSDLATGGFGDTFVVEQDGDASSLAQTTSTGAYTAVNHPNQGDHTWEATFSGNWSRQNPTPLEDLNGFGADGGTNYSDFGGPTNNRQRRAETFYFLNWAKTIARTADSGVDLFEITPCPQGDLSCDAVRFNIPQIGQSSCNGDFGDGFLNLHGLCSGQGANQEQTLRWLTFHEWGHSPRSAVQSVPGCTLCRAWEEGRADYFSYVANRLEFLRENALSSTTSSCCGTGTTCGGTCDFYPDDVQGTNSGDDTCASSCGATGGAYDNANIFSNVWLDLHYELGWRDTLARAHESVDEINANTVWSGGGSTNTFYHEMLESDLYYWDIGAWQHTIAKAFVRHDNTVGAVNWDWKDQWPGAPNPAYIFRALTTNTVVNRGEQSGQAPRLAFDFSKDSDYFWFYTWSGETYRFRTSNLGTGVDPSISWIRMVGGAEAVQFTSTDCADSSYGLNPCLNVVAGSNGWGAVRAFQAAGSGNGQYDFEVRCDDDAGDSHAASLAVANDYSYYNAKWEAAGDHDYFRVYVPEWQTGAQLVIETCEQAAGENPDTVIDVWHQDDTSTIVDTADDNGVCGDRSDRISYTIPSGKTGFYLFRVKHFSGTSTLGYKVRATISGAGRDVGGSSLATALALSNDELKGRYIAGDFTAESDEDWFQFTLAENEHITFHTADLRGACDTKMTIEVNGTNGYVRIPDTTKTWMRYDDDGGYEALASQLHFVAPRADTYYVRLRPYNGSALGAYTLYVQRMGNSATSLPAMP